MRNVTTRSIARTALAASVTLLASPMALASGWIVVDPITPRAIPIHPVVPIVRPGPRPTPIPSPRPGPVLQGGVSFGLHLQAEDVKVDINGPVARTYITQVFANDTDQNLAGTYLFPLPDDTTFSSFTLEIDGKPVEGKILEAQEARNEYESIVRRMVDPGLLEYADYKTVRARVFPIPAHGTKKIQLEYTQTLKADNGLYKYKFPLKIEESATAADSIKMKVALASPHGIKTIWSPTHTISATRDGDHKAEIKYEGKNVIPDKDFNLFYSISDKSLNADLLSQRVPGEDGYFLLSVAPPVAAKSIERKDIVLVADTSGSMNEEKLDQCKKALKYVVNSLNPGDRFGIVQFNTDAEAFKYNLVDATPENKKAAAAFVDDLEARGGTNIGEALRVGTNMLNAGEAVRPAYLVLMTDGEPTVGQTDVNSLTKLPNAKRDIRLFDFGVGYDVNTKLLNKLADGHHGTAQYVEPNENLETALSSFYQKIKSPVLSDVKIAYEGAEVKDVYPREVKDIFAGSQVMLIGKYKSSGPAKLKITGTLDGKQQSYEFPVTFPKEQSGHSYLNRLWAMRRIGYLTEVAQANGNTREVVDEIVALSKKHGIITQYTSFLATDPNEGNSRPGFGRPVPMSPQAAGGGGRGAMSGAAMDSMFSSPVRGRLATKALAAPPTMRQVQIIDDRPVVRDMRESANSSVATYGAAAQAPAEAKMRWKFSPNIYKLEAPRATGHDAVIASKSISNLRNSESVDDKEKAQGTKVVDDKTFYMIDGYWTDSDFDEHTMKPEEIEFGSTKYFDLMRANPTLRKYFAAGRQVIVTLKGKTYKIVPPKVVPT